MKHPFKLYILYMVFATMNTLEARAQMYTGGSGLIHVPSADMDSEGTARVGAHFLNREFTPGALVFEGNSYHTMTHYLSITPFRWIEIGYTCTLMKSMKDKYGVDDPNAVGLYRKDRYFSLKLQPLRERPGKWWPSVAIGCNDRFWSNKGAKTEYSIGNNFFANYYVAASKHIDLNKNSLGIHLAYRKWRREENAEWNGVVGGVTFQPAFYPDLRFIAEYTGNDIHVGIDCLLWKYLFLQGSLQNGKYFSGGLCLKINLLGKKRTDTK